MQKFGLSLIVLSYAKWAVIPFVHLFPITVGWKTATYVGLVGGAEIVFWSGVSIVGVETYRRLKSKFNFFNRNGKTRGIKEK